MADVFLSYSRQDVAVAAMLAKLLRELGVSVWWDRELAAGEAFRSEITRQLEMSIVVIVIWTPNSIESHFVHDEADMAARDGKLLPVLASGCTMNDVPLGFRSLQGIGIDATSEIVKALERKGVSRSALELEPEPEMRTVELSDGAAILAASRATLLYQKRWRKFSRDRIIATAASATAKDALERAAPGVRVVASQSRRLQEDVPPPRNYRMPQDRTRALANSIFEKILDRHISVARASLLLGAFFGTVAGFLAGTIVGGMVVAVIIAAYSARKLYIIEAMRPPASPPSNVSSPGAETGKSGGSKSEAPSAGKSGSVSSVPVDPLDV